MKTMFKTALSTKVIIGVALTFIAAGPVVYGISLYLNKESTTAGGNTAPITSTVSTSSEDKWVGPTGTIDGAPYCDPPYHYYTHLELYGWYNIPNVKRKEGELPPDYSVECQEHPKVIVACNNMNIPSQAPITSTDTTSNSGSAVVDVKKSTGVCCSEPGKIYYSHLALYGTDPKNPPANYSAQCQLKPIPCP